MSNSCKSWQGMSLPMRIDETARILRKRYGDFAHYNRKNPFEELLFIVCSVQTDEKKYRETFASLRRSFPRFGDLAEARRANLAKPLRSGGLAPTKSRMILGICRAISKRFGKPTLAPLKRLNDAECESVLTSLPGVGLKVSRCVMMYSLGRKVFPVDVHCWRVCRRLGWVRTTSGDGSCTGRDMERLQQRIPPNWRFSLHVNFISLGRELCKSKGPRCGECPVAHLCQWRRRQIAWGQH
jgi:endonuclease III